MNALGLTLAILFTVAASAQPPNCSAELPLSVLKSVGGSPSLVQAKNASSNTLYLDAAMSQFPRIDRFNDDSGQWEEIATWQCLNAASGTQWKVIPNGVLTASLDWHSAIDSRTGMMDLMGGEARPIAGRYRIRTRLSHHPWTNALQPPEGACQSISAEFRLSKPRT